jgi:uncharacterized protein YbjT (DUF2867 family)
VIVVAGGTGRLGRLVVERLRASGEEVRTMSRAGGDVRDPATVDRAIAGARVVISAVSAFGMKAVLVATNWIRTFALLAQAVLASVVLIRALHGTFAFAAR